MTDPTDPAALVARAHDHADLLSRNGMEPSATLIADLAAALSDALAREERMREACKAADEVLTGVHDCAEWWHGEQPDEEYIIRADNGRLHVLQTVAKQCRAALEPRQQEQDQ